MPLLKGRRVLGGPIPQRELCVWYLEFDGTVTWMVLDLRAVSTHRDDEADRGVRHSAKTSEGQAELENSTRRGLNIRTVPGYRLTVGRPLDHPYLRRPAVAAHRHPHAAGREEVQAEIEIVREQLADRLAAGDLYVQVLEVEAELDERD